MVYFFQEWKHKKMSVESSDGQFIMNFGEAEKSMIQNLEDAVVNLTNGASDEKKSAINYIEYLADCLKKGKVEVKWNIS
jgi:hemerythrin-like domain-containing protein